MAQIDAALAAARTAYAGAQAANDRAAMAATLRELRYWNARRATARIVLNSADATQVRFGSSVTILRDDGREQTFRIVGEDEANPSRGTISHVSPLARALFGKRVGERVNAGNSDAEIRNIR
jgi:transcription elongation GreA/GreB family factor